MPATGQCTLALFARLAALSVACEAMDTDGGRWAVAKTCRAAVAGAPECPGGAGSVDERGYSGGVSFVQKAYFVPRLGTARAGQMPWNPLAKNSSRLEMEGYFVPRPGTTKASQAHWNVSAQNSSHMQVEVADPPPAAVERRRPQDRPPAAAGGSGQPAASKVGEAAGSPHEAVGPPPLGAGGAPMAWDFGQPVVAPERLLSPALLFDGGHPTSAPGGSNRTGLLEAADQHHHATVSRGFIIAWVAEILETAIVLTMWGALPVLALIYLCLT